ncbi:nicotinate (nicotinamide) nucleotide adenylyltransferase [Niabella drilacis]|uniref:Probable nicotinate-nucleotide adenylyltransferase n=1 Tax=Niabella drilacis (strain DSM 25811 / CCM 8410 / CCUG 62505 / LMG 26954 / E90) TaxID=1285928 RepID=A0A1G6XFV9_NIADE|nr:nicotinate (nicotinamide) nucleotide adenylyltransferase [Niabella drilacis]SDD76215.1 nicotinate-nucleotide adenylyltransferase [Niabella drilacis]
MKIGLFFGSFNPIHHAHLIIANHILNQELVNKVWLVVSPHNPLKETASLLNENQRLHLTRLAIDNDTRMQATDIEFTLPRPSYTAVTLAHLSEKYPQHDFSLIMGGDSFQNIEKWKNYKYILENFNILIYNRPGFETDTRLSNRITLLDAPLLELSATHIRQLIKAKKSIRYLLPEAVIEEIEKAGYFRK